MAMEKSFILKRIIDAPVARVWRAWTEKDELEKWFGPKGFVAETHQYNLTPGGVYHYSLRDAEHGIEMWGKWTYREIVSHSRLVVEIAFSDKDLGVTRHPFAPEWPLHVLSTTSFEAEGDRTIVTTQWDTLNATAAEQACFDNGHDGMNQGWGGMMDQFSEYLTKNQH